VKRGTWVSLIAVSALVGAAFGARAVLRRAGAGQRGASEAKRSYEPRFAPTTPTDPADPFPLDGRLRTYETRHAGIGEGVLLYDRIATGIQRLSDGGEYVIVETWARTRGVANGRLVSREWFRREPSALLCGRRQEGPLVGDLEPPQPIVRYPLVVGDRWTWSGRAGGRPCQMTCVVAACERVKVPAGTFEDAWRIDSTVKPTEGADSIVRSLWVQPGLGVVEEKSLVVTDQKRVDLDAVLGQIENP
jgi:hypothetical protein